MHRNPGLYLVGLTGGVGSGKSTVGRMFADLGWVVLDADRLAHEILDEPEVVDLVVDLLGDEVMVDRSAPRTLDRKRVGARVFGDAGALAGLNAIVHPRVRRRMEECMAALAGGPGARGIVLDVPLLLETPYRDICDVQVFVDVPEDVRRERARKERGWDRGELERRESFQTPVEDKRRQADHVIRNDGPCEATLDLVRSLSADLQRRGGVRLGPA